MRVESTNNRFARRIVRGVLAPMLSWFAIGLPSTKSAEYVMKMGSVLSRLKPDDPWLRSIKALDHIDDLSRSCDPISGEMSIGQMVVWRKMITTYPMRFQGIETRTRPSNVEWSKCFPRMSLIIDQPRRSVRERPGR